MKLKKVLLTILLALVAIMLLQLQVNAGNVSEYLDSEYDYFLTESNKVLSKAELSDEANAGEYIVASILGDINNSSELIIMDLGEDSLDGSGKILDYVAQRICEFIPSGVQVYVPENAIIPASIFTTLESCDNKDINLCNLCDGYIYTFNSSDITNSNSDFRMGVEISPTPIGNMVDVNMEEVEYIKFKNSGSFPGKVTLWQGLGSGEDEVLDPIPTMYIYSFNETTQSYKLVDSMEDPYGYLSLIGKDWDLFYPAGGYLLTHQKLESEDENEGGIGSGPEDWCVETEVDSLVWTEEDINKVLEAIEETRNNTTDKQLYVHVPSGSKVPAKIFEAANGIDISIISEDGIWAEFSGGNYKAIDYVAGGVISNKAIDGMVNVGEDTIVYLSLKHEGQLPAKCYISYLDGLTMIGLGGEFNPVETKLYYFNEDVQKYELCGSGYMDLVYDLYIFEIDHCSSYVMSEEELPDEFVIKATTGEDKKEEVKQEEPKKEENKKEDTTKAPGKIPYAGGTTVVVISMLAVVAIGIVAYKKNKDLRGI